MSKHKKKTSKLVKLCQQAKRRLGYQFPAASSEEMRYANGKPATPPPPEKKPRMKVEHFSVDHKTGKETPIARPKDQFFRQKSEDRIVGIMPKMKKVKLKGEWWTQKALRAFFLNSKIICQSENRGWFITSDKPARVLTAADQLKLLMQDSDTEYHVNVNYKELHLVIDGLEDILR
jgi:hypothetical protein